MLELRNIEKSYGNLHVLKGIDMQVGDSEIVAILGPSGAGKSTLLHIAGTLDTADSGTIIYDGIDLRGLKGKKLDTFRSQNLGFIFQFHELLPEFTARENVALPALIAGKSRKEAYRKAAELLENLGLGDRMDHKPGELSGGEKQRTAIARALVNDPKLVLADEPTGSLDSQNRDEILGIISRMCKERGQSFLIVTHDTALTSIADRIIRMVDGRIESLLGNAE
ncbi:MAG: ABC transporter ATP-binding protein [Clostridium sp.]|nr:ABC transporter ATP-binding protein [Prevotella sp.]MCM1428878.1 ABC transporter ATP-binding protein [Clostridium sp.]MCM1475257.1 ABC transporter ATP-binding protein [Muribaculaceae bacterium]